MTFAERFCAQHHLQELEFEASLLRRCLHPEARFAWPLLRWLRPNHFAPDLALIRSIGGLARAKDFNSEAADFHFNPVNESFIRRHLRLRLSTRLLEREFKLALRTPVPVLPTPRVVAVFPGDDSRPAIASGNTVH